MRLGFPVKILGRADLRSHDGRRWRNRPHLSVSLAYVRDILLYLQQQRLTMYRLSPDLAPYLTHPDLPGFHHQIEECERQLLALGELAQRLDIRLSMHAPAYVQLGSSNEHIRRRSQQQVIAQARLLAAMRLGNEAVIVVHVGNRGNDGDATLARFAEAFQALPPSTQQRLVLENDDRFFGVADLLPLHRQLGIRLVFDWHHHHLLADPGFSAQQALLACLATWPAGQTPKIHISTPATELVYDRRQQPHPPRLTRHSHYVNPLPVIDFLRALPTVRDFDIMLEAKACDLAVLQFRRQFARLAPDLLTRFDIH